MPVGSPAPSCMRVTVISRRRVSPDLVMTLREWSALSGGSGEGSQKAQRPPQKGASERLVGNLGPAPPRGRSR